MPRPLKCRRVDHTPETTYFKPAGVPVSELEVVSLSYDELEAVRLADHEGLYQEEAALKMEVSRQTFGNIVASARKKIADALSNGKALRIEGGIVHLSDRELVCGNCGHTWTGNLCPNHQIKCPKCGSDQIRSIPDQPFMKRFGKRGRGRNQ